MTALLRATKAGLRLALDTLNLLRGWLVHAVSGTTPAGSYQAFVRLFCSSGGASNDLMTRAIVLLDRPRTLPEPRGELGIDGMTQAKAAAEQIRQQGYFVFPQRLAEGPQLLYPLLRGHQKDEARDEQKRGRHQAVDEVQSLEPARLAQAVRQKRVKHVRFDHHQQGPRAQPVQKQQP